MDCGDFALTNGKAPIQSIKPPPANNGLTASNFASKLDFQVKQFESLSEPSKSNQFGSFQSHTALSPTYGGNPLNNFPAIAPPAANFSAPVKTNFSAPSQNFSAYKSFTGATPAKLQQTGPNMSLNLSQSQSLLGDQVSKPSGLSAKQADWSSWSSNLQAPLLPAASINNSKSHPKTLSKDEINDLLG